MMGEGIEEVLYKCFKAFVSERMPIGGKVYYKGMRPLQENFTNYADDAVVSYVTARGKDVLEGTCLVNVYISDVLAPSGLYYKDKARCAEIGSLLEQFPSYANQYQGSVYFVRIDGIETIAEDMIKQHFVSLKMDFKVLNQY